MSKKWKRIFLAEHPTCCFCGGAVPSAEPDHQPGRVFFRDRKWPDGFVFPACVPCNRVSTKAENAIALLAAHFPDDYNRALYRKRAEWMRANHPEVIDSLRLTANEKRRAVKSFGLDVPSGVAISEMPLVGLDKAIWVPLFQIFARKLMLGFHYQALARPIPVNGGVWISVSTNADLIAGRAPTEIFEMANRLVKPTHHKRLMDDQLIIGWNAEEELGAAVFKVALHKRLVFSGLTMERPELLSKERDPSMFRPFCH